MTRQGEQQKGGGDRDKKYLSKNPKQVARKSQGNRRWGHPTVRYPADVRNISPQITHYDQDKKAGKGRSLSSAPSSLSFTFTLSLSLSLCFCLKFWRETLSLRQSALCNFRVKMRKLFLATESSFRLSGCAFMC